MQLISLEIRFLIASISVLYIYIYIYIIIIVWCHLLSEGQLSWIDHILMFALCRSYLRLDDVCPRDSWSSPGSFTLHPSLHPSLQLYIPLYFFSPYDVPQQCLCFCILFQPDLLLLFITRSLQHIYIYIYVVFLLGTTHASRLF